jgi:hypothetical protein
VQNPHFMRLVSGVGADSASYITLSGGTPLGPDGEQRLVDPLLSAQPPLLTSLDLMLTLPSASDPVAFRFHLILPHFLCTDIQPSHTDIVECLKCVPVLLSCSLYLLIHQAEA